MALSEAEQATLRRLKFKLDADMRGAPATTYRRRGLGFLSLEAYYEGIQHLEQIGLAVPDQLRDFVTIVNWPRTYVDAIVARLHPQGFMVGGGEADDELWRIWQANNLDTEFRMALVDMLSLRRGYLCAGTNDNDPDTPLITVESPMQMTHEWSNRYRRVTAAARFYSDEEDGKKVQRATLYQADATIWLRKDGRGWTEEDRDDHELGRVPVEPIINRSQTNDRFGRSEMAPVITLTDAACRALTDAQVATEVAAIPQKFAAGMSQADFKDPVTQEQLTTWETYFGSVWATANENAKFGQFSASDLNNFKAIVGLYAQLVSGDTGLPMRYLGQLADNPASEGAIRADESRLIGTAEEKQKAVDGPLEGIMRTARRIATGEDDPQMDQLSTDWRPAATPTQAEASVAAVALHSEGIYSRREALRSMGKSPKQIQVIESELREEQQDPVTQALIAGLGSGPAPVGP